MKKRILFLCTGNSCRSQMAEALARLLLPSLEAFSAGSAPAQCIDPLAREVMAELGADLSRQKPKGIDELPAAHFDLVVTLCGSARETCPVPPGGGMIVHRGFDDPPALTGSVGSREEALAVYRRVRDEIALFIRSFPDEFPFLFR